VSNLLSYASTVIIESEGKVWSVYIHNVNRIIRFKDMAMGIYKMAAGYNWKWCRLIRGPRKPHPRTKHKVNRTTCCWDMAIWCFQNGRWPPSWIWSNRKWRRSIRRPRKPHPRSKHEGDQMAHCRVMAIWNFPICVNGPWGRSVVGWSSIFILLTLISYSPLLLRYEHSARSKNVVGAFRHILSV